LFTAYGVGLLLSRPIIKFLQRDGMPLFTNALGVMATLTGNAIIGFVPGPVGFLTGLVFLGLGYGQCFAVLQKLAFDLVRPERRGRASGTIYISQDMGSTTGRYLLGYTAQMLGTYTANYRIVAGITLVPLFILLFVTLPDYQKKMASTASSSLK
jgi:MFS family permease